MEERNRAWYARFPNGVAGFLDFEAQMGRFRIVVSVAKPGHDVRHLSEEEEAKKVEELLQGLAARNKPA